MADEENREQEHGESEDTGDESSGRKQQIAESWMDDNGVGFTLSNGEQEYCDVSQLPPEVQFKLAREAARTAGRLSMQKMTDPVKARVALRAKFDRMRQGDVSTIRRNNETIVDDLTQALVNLTGKSVDFIMNTWYPRYFASKESGCRVNTTSDGKTRVYNKKQALAKLRQDHPGIAAELERIAKAHKPPKGSVVKIDIAQLAA